MKPRVITPARQAAVGLTLALPIAALWLGLHVWGVFLHRWAMIDFVRVPLVVALQTWLGTGLFIVAHDSMHGSLAPGRPRINATVGQLCVGAYAGFSLKRLAAKHSEHHKAPGTASDPDFHADRPTAFLAWYVAFFRRYFGVRELLMIAAVVGGYMLLGASPLNAGVFWGLPAILSSLQLFTFGTWLPHRHNAGQFADRHNARTLDYPWIASLMSCFHFGLHHEHHLRPSEPWWRLPQHRNAAARGG